MDQVRLLVKYLRPLNLLAAALLYWLGAGIGHYLGTGTDWNIYAIGQAWLLVLQLGIHFLVEYFRSIERLEANPYSKPANGHDETTNGRTLFLAAFAFMAVLAFITVVMVARFTLSSTVVIFMVAVCMAGLFYAAPPIKLEVSGYGELIISVLACFGLPLFSFSLQAGVSHKLVAMTTIPLALMCLAMLIILELRDFGRDLKDERRTLVTRMGWKIAMNVHHGLVASAFLVVLLATFYGLPGFAATAAALILPIAALQVFQVWRISLGERPNWGLLIPNALASFGFMVYLLGFSYWTH